MLAVYNLMKGHAYYLRNYGEEFRFEVIDIDGEDVHARDLLTLENFRLQDVFLSGHGPDYELHELSD